MLLRGHHLTLRRCVCWVDIALVDAIKIVDGRGPQVLARAALSLGQLRGAVEHTLGPARTQAAAV